MAEQAIDVLMRVVGAAGPFPAESLTMFAGSAGTDTLRNGFVPGQFCELRDFGFSAGIRSALPRPEAGETVDMQPVDFTRIMDSASTLLFKAMVECETLPELSIVKRKAAGSLNSGACYLRLDFEQVLVTKLEWQDREHLVMEAGSFIYRKVTIRYRPQNDDGSLGTTVQSTWTMARP